MNPAEQFNDFISTIKALRNPSTGCPWDLKQTHQSLIKYLIEETFECVDAIESHDMEKIKDELGDILLQVVLHSVIAEEDQHFNISKVISSINEKMIRRHPHVFDKTKVSSIEEVKKNWEEIKRKEQNVNMPLSFSHSILSNTSLLSAYKIGEKTNKLDFDWDNPKQVLHKVSEELQELKEEINNSKDFHKIDEEFGDLLFSMVQLGRHLNINPENSLRAANKKFINRFTKMELAALEKQENFADYTREKKERAWNAVKEVEKK